MTCTVCGKRAYSDYCVAHKPRKPLPRATKPLAVRKRPKQRGKEFYKWAEFRDEVAKPWLDKYKGHKCSVVGCKETERLEVDHIQGRGSHPDLKYELKNLQYMCHYHHRLKTDHML